MGFPVPGTGLVSLVQFLNFSPQTIIRQQFDVVVTVIMVVQMGKLRFQKIK
jgi:hypothetical protein